jgi:hypothetical protein
MRILLGALASALFAAGSAAAVTNVQVLSENFDGPATVAAGVGYVRVDGGGGVVSNAPTSGFFGQPGVPGFGTAFFRNASGGSISAPGSVPPGQTLFTLSNLGAHKSVTLNFDLAFIDSWDGVNGIPAAVSPDYLFLTVDGVVVAQLTVNNVLGGAMNLAGGTQTGFGRYTGSWLWNDRVVSMNSSGAMTIAHTASTLSFGIQAGGAGWQGGDDESWGVDNLKVYIAAVPEPATWATMIGGFGLVGGALRRRRAAVAV